MTKEREEKAQRQAIPIECCVPNCTNNPWQGNGEFLVVGNLKVWMCSPCLEFVFGNEGENNTVCRNALDKAKCKTPNIEGTTEV